MGRPRSPEAPPRFDPRPRFPTDFKTAARKDPCAATETSCKKAARDRSIFSACSSHAFERCISPGLPFSSAFSSGSTMRRLMAAIRSSLKLSDQEVAALLILNVALTIPARVVIGMLVDKLGPRLMFSLLLAVSGVLCIPFALATDYTGLALARFFLAIAGAGFVVGIRMIGEWFPAKETGLAQGIYAGFGNFGSAAAAVTLPSLALYFGGDNGWRYALLVTGAIAIIYAGIYYLSVSNTPKGSTYFSPKKIGALEVTSRGDFVLYALMQAPLVLALALTDLETRASQSQTAAGVFHQPASTQP